ncbi:MAG: signal recognition particle-docking protein FtsY [Spirochaetes bacterium]|nr:signal recognition particle-docking protein FtsY [Spirochaetota bacterium]NLJ04867.1 signal recognition particle-docking protein FtsY [Exilispira sp.]MBP8991376.1 signal recognition particle-docking protein FtsY [Spirochaetota bacterium]HOV46284.1 signal recognition particle-docking protein FtsY [Exilispira sp.]HPO60557.1 signal recognition particle-docking protein FtsY [Exilispira sp.]
MNLFSKIKELFSKSDDLKEIEKNLLLADFDYELTQNLLEIVKKFPKEQREEKLRQTLSNLIIIDENPIIENKLNVILIAGVNGVGKTTAISKLANFYLNKNKTILLAAADTYRAAAIEQLSHWADRLKIDLVKQKQGADPAAVVFDAIDKSIGNNKSKYDILIIDTAGRLQNKEELMQQLQKINKVIDKKKTQSLDLINCKSILIIDATLGKNSITQAEIFHKMIHLDAFALTKLDSTAKGGAIFTISHKLNLPLAFISFGEKIENYMDSSAPEFKETILNKI